MNPCAYSVQHHIVKVFHAVDTSSFEFPPTLWIMILKIPPSLNDRRYKKCIPITVIVSGVYKHFNGHSSCMPLMGRKQSRHTPQLIVNIFKLIYFTDNTCMYVCKNICMYVCFMTII